MKKSLIILVAILSTFMFAAESCDENSAPSADSDSRQKYADGSTIPVDDNVYELKGEVIGPVNEVTRQVEPSKGSLSGPACYGTSGCFGGTSGTFTGPIEAGKTFIRLRVQSASPSTDLAPIGDVSIIKTSDTKAAALLTGDIVTFKCRRQYEAVAAVRDNEKFNADKLETWELDYCRLATPVIDVKPGG